MQWNNKRNNGYNNGYFKHDQDNGEKTDYRQHYNNERRATEVERQRSEPNQNGDLYRRIDFLEEKINLILNNLQTINQNRDMGEQEGKPHRTIPQTQQRPVMGHLATRRGDLPEMNQHTYVER